MVSELTTRGLLGNDGIEGAYKWVVAAVSAEAKISVEAYEECFGIWLHDRNVTNLEPWILLFISPDSSKRTGSDWIVECGVDWLYVLS